MMMMRILFLFPLSVVASTTLIGCEAASQPSQGVDARASHVAQTLEPDVTTALDAWINANHDAAVEEFAAVATTPGRDLRIAPVMPESAYPALTESERSAIFDLALERSKALGQISRELRARAASNTEAGKHTEAERLNEAVRAVAAANAGPDVLAIYRARADAILKSIAQSAMNR